MSISSKMVLVFALVVGLALLEKYQFPEWVVGAYIGALIGFLVPTKRRERQ